MPPRKANKAKSRSNDVGSAIKVSVCVRVRPLLRHELKDGQKNMVDLKSNQSFTLKVYQLTLSNV